MNVKPVLGKYFTIIHEHVRCHTVTDTACYYYFRSYCVCKQGTQARVEPMLMVLRYESRWERISHTLTSTVPRVGWVESAAFSTDVWFYIALYDTPPIPMQLQRSPVLELVLAFSITAQADNGLGDLAPYNHGTVQ